MLKKIFALIAMAGVAVGVMAADSEKVFVPLKGIVILTPGFRATDINITDRGIISAEPIANDQIRVTGLAVGKSDLHITAGTVAKLYTVTVNDNVREVFNALRRDLDSVPEVEISINGNNQVVNVPNTMRMPIFERRMTKTNVECTDNGTIIMGGMIQDETTTLDDAYPILGDLPLIGRLFQSKGRAGAKKNLMIFLSCRLVNPDGSPLREREDPGIPSFRN